MKYKNIIQKLWNNLKDSVELSENDLGTEGSRPREAFLILKEWLKGKAALLTAHCQGES